MKKLGIIKLMLKIIAYIGVGLGWAIGAIGAEPDPDFLETAC